MTPAARRSRSGVLGAMAASGVVLTAALGAATNVGTEQLPSSWRWVHNPEVIGSTVAGSIVLLMILAAVQQRMSRTDTATGTSVTVLAARAATPEPGFVSLAPPQLTDVRLQGRHGLVQELANLYRRQTGPRSGVRVLTGMGGAGKTTVAQLLAWQLSRAGVRVWWVSAATDNQLQAGMRLLADDLGASGPDIQHAWSDAGSGPDLVWRLLGRLTERWLLVIDNADDLRLLAPTDEPVAAGRGWVRPVPDRRGLLVLTTRDGAHTTWPSGHHQEPASHPWYRLHPVGMLTPADGAKVLLSHAGNVAGSVGEATALAERLGGLPLALSIAGQTINVAHRAGVTGERSTFAGYRAALGAYEGRSLHRDRSAPSDTLARRTIDQTWELSLDLLDSRGLPQARILLRLLATFADTPIPTNVLDPAVLSASDLLPHLTSEHLADLLLSLAGVGLLTTGPLIELHPLIRDTSRRHLCATKQHHSYLALAIVLLDSVSHRDPHDPADWPAWQMLTPHVTHALAQAGREAGIGNEALTVASELAYRTARYLAAAGIYHGARDLVAAALPVMERVRGAEHPDSLVARHKHASWSGLAGDVGRARDLLAALLPVVERVQGAQHPDALGVRHNLASWTGLFGDPAGARDLLTAVLPVAELVQGAEHPDTLVARHKHASWSGLAGDPGGARDLLAALLPVMERVRGAEHPETLLARHKFASWTGLAGDPGGARDQLAALIPIMERVQGADHPETLVARHKLASWTGVAGDPAIAYDLLNALLPVMERVVGADHPDSLVVRHKHASWKALAGDPAGALELLTALLPVAERVWGSEHPDTLSVRYEHARCTGRTGDPVSARDLFAALLPVTERVRGVKHPVSLSILCEHAHWTGSAGDPASARRLLATLLPVVDQVQGGRHPDTLSVRYEHARWTGSAGDPAGAGDLFATLLPLVEQVQGPDHPNAEVTRSQYAHWTQKAASHNH